VERWRAKETYSKNDLRRNQESGTGRIESSHIKTFTTNGNKWKELVFGCRELLYVSKDFHIKDKWTFLDILSIFNPRLRASRNVTLPQSTNVSLEMSGAFSAMVTGYNPLNGQVEYG
jgi:hypothetical protein